MLHHPDKNFCGEKVFPPRNRTEREELKKKNTHNIPATKIGIIHIFSYLGHGVFSIYTTDIIHTTMSIRSLFGGKRKKITDYPTDVLTARDGTSFTIHFFKHAALAIGVGEKYVYVDPVNGYADYGVLPKADVLLVTHSHYDHLDRAATDELLTPHSEILCDRTSAEAFEMNCHTMRPGSVATPCDWLKVEAVAAYNTSPDHRQFHPRDREDCGYVLTIGGTRIYIAGDTEPTPEMKALRGIDIAFLPVNQPYTMTVDQAVEAVKALHPAIFYPYHYGEVEEKTDIDRLVRELEGITEVRVRPME